MSELGKLVGPLLQSRRNDRLGLGGGGRGGLRGNGFGLGRLQKLIEIRGQLG